MKRVIALACPCLAQAQEVAANLQPRRPGAVGPASMEGHINSLNQLVSFSRHS